MIITAGIYKGRKVTAPDENITRPTLSKVRMGVFNSLYSILGDFDGKTFLDVFGGSGIMGLEALSRGFSKVKVFEKNNKAAQVLRKNYEALGVKPDLVIGDSLKLVRNISETYDVAYVDPPYESEIYTSIIKLIPAKILIAEHSTPQDYSGFEVIKQKNYGGKLVTFLNNTVIK